ncbi:glucose-1-phosphatase, partial [Salmonella enterica subsp. enterica serovar Anatum]|nr:glucose-1-phosphatase [Salmonella enterica subsp. enterica serovar Anatum]
MVKLLLSRYSYSSPVSKENDMLYIFDLGNVIVDIDFNRVLGVWSDLSRVP